MEYNNYYPAGHPPPPPPHMQPNQGGYSQLSAGDMMHIGPGPPPPQAMRQVGTPGPPPGHPQMQPQQPPPPPPSQPMMGGPPQHMQSMPPQHHPGYHHPPPPPLHHPALPHSGSPHPNQQPNINMNLQPPSRPSTGPSPQHPMHQQSPHLVGGPPPPPPMHVQQQQPSQQLNHVGGPPSMSLSNNQPQPGMQQHPNQNFMSPGPIPPSPQYNHPNQHQPPTPLPPPLNQSHPPSSIPTMHHHHASPQGPPPPSHSYLPHQPTPLERGSPFYQNIPQTEFRIIELNKRLQNRPRPRGPAHPLPQIDSSGESYWWEKFACDFFDNDATLTLRAPPDDKPVEYTIGRTLIPRFFRSYFEGGVVDLSIKLRSIRETVHPQMIALDCDQTDITTKNIFKYRDMPMYVVVHSEGHLSLEFVSNSFDTLLIKSWRFYTNQCREYIDRSMTTAAGLPQTFLTEPVTRFGLTKHTISYLKMCMIMEPMQDLMMQHRQTQMNPRSCLKHLLFDKYKVKSVEDNRTQPTRRKKRKAPATTGVTKKNKANANNANVMNNNSNNIGFNNINNSLMSSPMHGGGPGGGVMPNLSLTSQDVMVVGEPSMLGADFGDENERRITRLENNQFESPVNNNSNTSNNISQQNHNQMCNNAINQNPNQSNNMNRIPQQNNHDTGNIQMMSHMNNNNNNGNNDNKPSDPNKPNNNNGNIGSQNNNNHQQMNLISMNGNTNHINHIIKSEMDLKQSTATPTSVDSEQTR